MSPTSLTSRIIVTVQGVLDERGISGAELARQLEVSQTWVWRRLNGEVAFDVDDLERIAAVLAVPVEALLPASTAA